MKKKIILILSMVALLVCVFAISVNADDFNSPFASESVSVNLPTYYMTYDGSFDIPPAMILNESYELVTYYYFGGHTFHYNDGSDDCVMNSILQYPVSDDETLEVYDMKLIKAYLESKDVVDFNSFNVWRKNISANGPFDDFLIFTVTEEIYEKMFIFKESSVITEADLTAKYEEGKTAGVTEYETVTLPGLITAAKAEAVEDYEANTLPGLISEAVSDHKMSAEHKAELDAQLAAGEELGKQSGYLLGHSDGYNEGYADGEAENKNGAPIAIVSCLAILLPLVIAALIISSKKKKKII